MIFTKVGRQNSDVSLDLVNILKNSSKKYYSAWTVGSKRKIQKMSVYSNVMNVLRVNFDSLVN